MATRKNEIPDVREVIQELTRPTSEVHACKLVRFRHANALLETDGVSIGDFVNAGMFSGLGVVGLYVTQHGCVVELARVNGQRHTILHTGDYAAELADA